jgi:molybdopterin molybdotransferase
MSVILLYPETDIPEMSSNRPITAQEAGEAIFRHMPKLPAERRRLSQCVGRILRQEVVAERDNPPFDRVCMDGIAVSDAALAAGVRRFVVESTQAAGAPPLALQQADRAIEVMTGAMLPAHTNVIIPLEQYSLESNVATLTEQVNAEPFKNVQRRGEDGASGSLMLSPGTMMGAAEIAVAASAGLGHLLVGADPRFMIISTGDELIEPGEPIAEQQVRRSNAYAMVAALRARGFQQVANDHIVDDETKLRERLALHLATHDVLILSGGVSMGKFDLVPKVLQQLGVREIFHRVAQRPGKPLWFGVGPEGQAVFGLPGNPVSTLICLIRYVVTGLNAAAGATVRPPERLALNAPITFDLPMTLFMPVTVVADEWGRPWVKPKPTNTSGDHLSLLGTDGFIELPPGPRTYPKEFVANLYRW